MTQTILRGALCAAFLLTASAPVLAQQMVYPAKGQSAKKQATDESACSNWR